MKMPTQQARMPIWVAKLDDECQQTDREKFGEAGHSVIGCNGFALSSLNEALCQSKISWPCQE